MPLSFQREQASNPTTTPRTPDETPAYLKAWAMLRARWLRMFIAAMRLDKDTDLLA